MIDVDLVNAEIMEWCGSYKGPPFHSCLCDPPYELGMMSKSWDSTGIAFRPDTWAALAEHLYPGAFVMAFAGTRGYHRMAVAMEDAGLIIHPAIGWTFGSGFPKATRVRDNGVAAPGFEGHRYGGQVLKPAFEFIAVAQKPYDRRPVDSIVATGAGALNIDGGRIAANNRPHIQSSASVARNTYGDDLNGSAQIGTTDLGRWPANLILDEAGAAVVDRQSGELKPGGGQPGQGDGESKGIFGMGSTVQSVYDDSGGASRYFYRYQQDSIKSADPLYYTAKADRAEREAGLKGNATPERAFGVGALRDGGRGSEPRKVNDGRQTPVDNPYQRGETLRYNVHPTVKPLDLCRYLATLLLPPRAYAPRRLLVPFAGTGSEMIGAYRAGWDCIVGVEMTPEYVQIGRARLEHWLRQGVQLDMFDDR